VLARSTHASRRQLLQAGVLSAFGLTWPELLRARASLGRKLDGKAKACILLYMTGGPAQQETFDPKTDAPSDTRGEFQPTATSVPGVQICEHLPKMAKVMHHCAVFRSVFHGSDTHGIGVHYNLTGLKPPPRRAGEPQLDRRDPPSIGGVMRQLRGDRNGLPAAVQLPRPVGDQNNAMWAGQHAGVLGAKYDPLFLFDETWVPGQELPGFSPARDVSGERQKGRAELLALLDKPARTEAEQDFDRFQHLALDVMKSESAWRAFRLDDEKPGTIERYGDNRFGRSVLIARRLIESGVALVTVPWVFKQSEQNFDTHSKHFAKMKSALLPPVDSAFSALIEDLKDRGVARHDPDRVDRRVRPHAEDQWQRRPRPLGPRVLRRAGRRWYQGRRGDRQERQAGRGTGRQPRPRDRPVRDDVQGAGRRPRNRGRRPDRPAPVPRAGQPGGGRVLNPINRRCSL